MATLLAYVWYARRPTLFRYVTMSILFALGLLAKPMLVTVPLVMLLLDYWPLRRIAEASTLLRLVAEKIPLFLLAAASCVATLWAQKQSLGSTEVFRFSWRVENALVSVVIYLGQIFWPHDLAAFYPHPEDRLSILEVIGAAVVLISITVAAVALRKRRPELFTGWFWYLIMLAPVLGLVQVGLQSHADRYTYLPGIGISVAIVWIVVDFGMRWRYRRELFAIAAVVIVGALAVSARAQTAFWRDSETLWRRALAVTKDNDLAHINLSEILVRTNRYDEAISHCREAIRIYSNNPAAYYNLGLSLLRTGHLDKAIPNLEKTLELRPDHINAALTLAWIFATCPDSSVRNGPTAVEVAEK